MLVKLLHQPLTVGHAVVLVAIAVAIGGGAFAVASIPGPGGTIKGCARKSGPLKGTLRVIDSTKRCSGQERTLTWNQQGPQGLAGQPGPQGTAGEPGAQGVPGAAGSPDTGADILGKLAPVDGSGSGLDADTLDGVNSTGFLTTAVVPNGNRVIHNDANLNSILSTSSFDINDDGDTDTDKVVQVTNNNSIGAQDLVVVNETGAPVTIANLSTNTFSEVGGDNFLDLYIRDLIFARDFYVRCAFEDPGSGNRHVQCMAVRA
jgi:hypothetical protein